MIDPQMPNYPPPGPPLAYAVPLSQHNRPGLVTAIGVISIVVASISGLSSVGTGFEAVGLYMMSKVTSALAAATPPSPTIGTSVWSPITSTGAGSSSVATTSPSTSMPSTNLTTAEVGLIVRLAQLDCATSTAPKSSSGMTTQQLNTLTATLSNPNQQLITSTTAANGLTSASIDSAGNMTAVFSDGALTIDPQGQIVTSPLTLAPVVPTMPVIKISGVACALAALDGLLSVGLAIYLLVAGILVLRRTATGGRKMHLAYAVLKIPLAIGGSMAIAWMLSDFYGSMMAAQPGGAGAAGFMQGISAVYALGFALPALIYPIALLIVLNTRQIREYFNSVTM